MILNKISISGLYRIFMGMTLSIALLMLVSSCTNDKQSESLNKRSDSFNTEWKFQTQREEIASLHWVDEEIRFGERATLALSGDGKEYSIGCWCLEKDVVPDSFYEFQTHFQQKDINEPNRSVIARVDWLGKDGKRIHQPEYPRILREKTSRGWNIIQQRYRAPEDAASARLELIFRWDANGTVYFSEATFKEVPQLNPRPVRLATIHYRPQNGSSSMENLQQFAEYIKIASERGADIVCLPEGITLAGTGKTYVECSESVPGQTTDFLGKLAREYNLYIVAGILEREGPVVYNTAVLMDKDGSLAGKYRKVSLPREEYEGGVTPGNSIPVFETEFGRIGIMICWDSEFPEVARMLAWKGAEVIFVPIWGGNLTLVRARAIENQVYLVTSSYGMQSGVFDLEGNLIAEANDDEAVAVIEVDLNEQKFWRWLGELKNRIPREIPGSDLIDYQN